MDLHWSAYLHHTVMFYHGDKGKQKTDFLTGYMERRLLSESSSSSIHSVY